MGWIVLSLLIGGGLGALSAYHTKAFLSGLASCAAIGFILLRPVLAVGASASAAAGEAHPLSLYFIGFSMLPDGLRGAIILFPAFGIMGRAATWVYRYMTEPPYEEMRQARIDETMSEFGPDHTWENIINPPIPEGYRPFKKLKAPPEKSLFDAQ